MKKLLSLLLVFSMIFTLSACSFGKSNEEAASEVVNGFMNAFVTLDVEKISSYLDNPDVIPEDFANLNKDTLKEGMISSISLDKSTLASVETDIDTMIDTILNKYQEYAGYEILSVEENNGNFYFTVSVTIPKMEEMDLDDIMEDSVTEDAMMELILSYYEEGKISDNTSEEELATILLPELFGMINKELESIELETETSEKVLCVSKKNGSWLIDSEESDLG